MPATFKNDNDIIVYALECVISHARQTQQIFMPQGVWWLASIIGLEQELVFHIDKLQGEKNTTKLQGEKNTTKLQGEGDTIPQQQLLREVLTTPRDHVEDQRIDQMLDCTKQYLRESKQLREIAALKVSGQTATGRINPSRKTRKSLRKERRISKVVATNKQKDCNSKTERIDDSEIKRRKAAGECLRCAWPSDRKGIHRVKDCVRQIKLDKGTAIIPKGRNFQRPVKTSEGSDPADSFDSQENTD